MIKAIEAFRRSHLHNEHEKWLCKIEKAILEETKSGSYFAQVTFSDNQIDAIRTVVTELERLGYSVDIQYHATLSMMINSYSTETLGDCNFLHIYWCEPKEGGKDAEN